MIKDDFYTNRINKKCAKIDGQSKLKGVAFTKLIEKTNEIIDTTNTNKDSTIENVNGIRKS